MAVTERLVSLITAAYSRDSAFHFFSLSPGRKKFRQINIRGEER